MENREANAEAGRRGIDIVVATALVLVSVALRLHEAAARTLWSDELFSLGLAHREWIDLVRATVKDVVHPPLFFVLLKVWIAIGGERPLWLRSLPILFSILSLIPTFLLSRELKLSRRAFRLSLLFIACSGFLIRYGQELRMYSLLQLLSVTSLYLFVRFLRAARPSVADIAAMAVVNVAMVYTHYYGWIVLGCQGLFLLLARRSRLVAFLAGMLPVVIAFVPWLWLVRRREVDIGGWENKLGGLSRPGWDELLGYFTGLVGPSPHLLGGGWLPGLLILGVSLLLALTVVLGRARDPEPSERFAVGFLALLSFIPVALVFTASHWLPRPIFMPRYLIIAAVPFLLLLGILLDRVRPPMLRTALIALVAGWSILGTVQPFVAPDRVAWGDLVHLMRTRCPNPAAPSEKAPISVLGRGNRRAILYYLQREMAEEDFEVRLVRDVSEIAPEGGWVASRSIQRDESTPERVSFWGGMSLAEMQLALLNRGFRVGCVFQSGRPPEEGYVISIRRTVPERKTTD